jgi:hypothetical protein
MACVRTPGRRRPVLDEVIVHGFGRLAQRLLENGEAHEKLVLGNDLLGF